MGVDVVDGGNSDVNGEAGSWRQENLSHSWVNRVGWDLSDTTRDGWVEGLAPVEALALSGTRDGARLALRGLNTPTAVGISGTGMAVKDSTGGSVGASGGR